MEQFYPPERYAFWRSHLRSYETDVQYPVGINATYRAGKRRFYTTDKADDWKDVALIDIQRLNMPKLKGPHWWSLEMELYTTRMDVDSAIKGTQDLIRDVLCLDDSWCGYVSSRKRFVRKYKDRRFSVRVHTVPVEDKWEWTHLSSILPAGGMDAEKVLITHETVSRAISHREGDQHTGIHTVREMQDALYGVQPAPYPLPIAGG